MIVYDGIFERLAAAGWTSYRLVKEKQLGNSSMTQLRRGLAVSTATIDVICRLCSCQPGDLMHWEPDKERAE